MDWKKTGEKIKEISKKIWFILWKDNSFKGWLLSIVFLFVVIKFIFFPFLNLVTGTTLPLAIVESCSMYHQGYLLSDFNSWFERHDTKYSDANISKEEFRHFSMKNGFSKGDIMLLIKANPDKLKIGDIIAFNSGDRSIPVIHRIISIREENGEKIFTTLGDNNAKSLEKGNNAYGIDETEIHEDHLVGKAVFRILPFFGWAKLAFFEPLRPESERGFCEER